MKGYRTYLILGLGLAATGLAIAELMTKTNILTGLTELSLDLEAFVQSLTPLIMTILAFWKICSPKPMKHEKEKGAGK